MVVHVAWQQHEQQQTQELQEFYYRRREAFQKRQARFENIH